MIGILEEWEMCPSKVLEFLVQNRIQTPQPSHSGHSSYPCHSSNPLSSQSSSCPSYSTHPSHPGYLSYPGNPSHHSIPLIPVTLVIPVTPVILVILAGLSLILLLVAGEVAGSRGAPRSPKKFLKCNFYRFPKGITAQKSNLHQEQSYHWRFYDDHVFIKENYNILRH